MLAYLHIKTVSFYSIGSNFLVEREKGGNAFRNYENHPELWLEDHFKKKKKITMGEVEPCSPNKMYRLASKYEIEELKSLSLMYITKSLTVQNVSPFLRLF